MFAHLQEWLGFSLRWLHLIAGISWIGSSFYFMWLDASFEPPTAPRSGVDGEVWMTHGGNFYQVEKRKLAPGELPKTLHWFKWEAFFTWLTGILLLINVYYLSGGIYLLDPAVSQISASAASLLGLGALVVSWFLYDWLWQSRLAKSAAGVATAVCYAGLVGSVYVLCHYLSGRAAFIHVGAMLGSIMVLNVWVRILPGQRRMIAASQEGRTPDYELGIAAKRRSTHNSYMTFPVLFIMLSNHYPMTFAGEKNGLILLLLIFAGAAIRHVMIGKTATKNWAAIPATAAIVTVFFMTAPRVEPTPVDTLSLGESPVAMAPVTFTQVNDVISKRCLACHSQRPTDDIFKVAPNGVTFDSPQMIGNYVDRIRVRAVETKTMPLANKTGMTGEERAMLSRWISEGARIE